MREIRSDVKGACFCFKMREAARRITRTYEEASKSTGLRATQFTMLATIAVMEDATLTELAESQGLERTTLLRNLQPLERKGLIEMTAAGSGRARYARLTDQGIEALQQALPLWRDAQEKMERTLGPEMWKRVHQELDGVLALI